MKILIDGSEYELGEAIANISNGTIKAMSQQSALVGAPVTMDYLEKQRLRLEAMQADPEVTPLQMMTDIGYIDVQTSYIFIAKRYAGEQITWADAEGFGPNSIEMPEDEPVAEVVAPKELADTSPPVLPQ